MNRRARAIFFDRDGVVNFRLVGDYVRSPEQLVLIPDVFDALRVTRELGFIPILVTNQRGIARGRMSEEDLHEIHRLLQSELARRSVPTFHAIYYCPHGRDAGCDCRKPEPGMLLRAAREHDIDLADSWMIGDSYSDIEAGERAGCLTAWVGPGGGDIDPDMRKLTLTDIMRSIEADERRRIDERSGRGRSDGRE